MFKVSMVPHQLIVMKWRNDNVAGKAVRLLNGLILNP